jgi:peptide-methionine (S)-S-oxide reductase
MNEIATFGAGCFWGVEEVFRKMNGVISTQVGYSGGDIENPTYKEVCGKNTGHAEVVEVTYNPEKITYKDLLKKFFDIHDPTQLNRQGPDIGDQYRSVIFTHGDVQDEEAKKVLKDIVGSDKFTKEIATEISSAKTFYKAEEYHQQYIAKSGGHSCAI